MENQNSIANKIEHIRELNIDELDASGGESFFGDLVATVKAAFLIATGSCDIDHSGILR